ncbi:MAG: SDR family oxidoreductase [Opitutales bacterium]
MSTPHQEAPVVAIVGGTTGLGLSAARALAYAGWKLALLGRNPDSLDAALTELGETAVGIAADACNPQAAPSLIDKAVESFGCLDALYHVAGGSARSEGDGPLHELTDEGWQRALEHNLTSLVYSNRAAVRHFREQDGGSVILNMGSVLGFSPSPAHFATHGYAATKAAVIGFTKSIASYYAKDGIRANVVAPALVETPMSERAAANEEIMSFVRSKQPLDGGRIGTPEDLDAAVVYLLSDESRFVTGQVLAVDGGWSVTEGQLDA